MSEARTIASHQDSLSKMLHRIQLVAKVPVYYQGKRLIYEREDIGWCEVPVPHEIRLAPSLLRQFTCVTGCTACCLPFSLDFTPEEFESDWVPEVVQQAEEVFEPRIVNVNGKEAEILTYPQYKDPSCPFLKPVREGGNLGCSFYPNQPLECASAPQLLMTTRGIGVTMVTKRAFGRAWKWKNPPQCEFDPVPDRLSKIPDDFDLSNEIGLLRRYAYYADYFGIPHWIREIIDILEDFPAHLRRTYLQAVVLKCE